MGRPVYPHEMCDPDFAWLISNFKEQNPSYISVESTFLPLVLIATEDVTEAGRSTSNLALPDPNEFVKTDLADADEF